MTLDQTITLAHAGFCGGICFVIAFMYRRGGSSYKFLPSLCAFCLASLFGQEWLSIVGAILLYGQWPATSVPSTLIFGILFILALRSRGNVARLFDQSRHRPRATK